MVLNEEFLSIYEELSELNSNLAEKFDMPGAEVVYGEEATTVEGVLRYFVEDIHTLAAIVSRGRIKASQQKETDTQTPRGEKQHKKRPFVSFSRQLFSHAYRAPKKWKYGIAVSQEKLEHIINQLDGVNASTDFDHPGSTMHVYGAAKLQDGTELLITSFGSFTINLNDNVRQALKQHQGVDVERTDFYDKIKNFFDGFIEKRREAKPDVLISYTEDINEIEKHLIKRRPIESKVVEGFLLRSFCRIQSMSPYFAELYKEIPGLFEYVKEHTNLNEGEFRVWLSDNQQYLNIEDCIVGIVLPSNYKENNLDNPENTAPDVLYLRKLISEKDLTVYVYQSKEESNIPDIDLSRKQSRTLKRPSIMEYFHKITSSREAVIDFVKNELTKYKAANGCIIPYIQAIAKNTTTSQKDVSIDTRYNYRAFLEAIQEFGLNDKDVVAIYKTGHPLLNAETVFNEKTKSLADVQLFLKLLGDEYPNMPMNIAYKNWFIKNTNATAGSSTINQDSVSWRSFINYCKQNFNYTGRDLTAISNGQINTERAPIKELFKKAAGTNRKTTLKYIKNFATEFSFASLGQSYVEYMGKYAADTSSRYLQKNTDYNYKAWLEKVTDPNGPVKLTREEVLNYFKEFKAEVENNN